MASVAGTTRPSCVRVRRSAPNERGGSSLGLEHLVSRRSLPGMLHPWARAGSRRFPGDPSYASALLQDPGRADKASPLAVLPTPPPAYPNRRPQRVLNLEANTGLQHLLSTLHERRRRLPCKTRFRLAGCASTGRGSNPLDRFERFQVTFPFSFPGLLLSQVLYEPNGLSDVSCSCLSSSHFRCRVGGDVAAPTPHRPGRADLPSRPGEFHPEPTRQIRTSGSVRGGGGNVPTYSADHTRANATQ